MSDQTSPNPGFPPEKTSGTKPTEPPGATDDAAAPVDRAARQQARRERMARREAMQERRRDNPPEVRRLAYRFELAGVPAEASVSIARCLTGHSGDADAPDVTDALTVQAVALLSANSRYRAADSLLEPLRGRILAAGRRVKDWDSLHAMLGHAPRAIGPRFDSMVERMREHPDAIAAGVDEATVEGWRQSARLRMLKKLFARPPKPIPKSFRMSLRDLGSASPEVWADPRGTIFVTVHNPHLDTLSRWAKETFPEFHGIRAADIRNPERLRGELMTFVRKLRRGGVGVVAPDGAFGNVDREIEIFGERLPIADAFARIAWTSGSRIIFTIGSSQGRPTGLTPRMTELPRRSADMTDIEDYVDSVMDALAAAVREAMVRFPFDTGVTFRLGASPAEESGEGE